MKIGDSSPFAPTRRSGTTRKSTAASGFSESLGEAGSCQETSQASACTNVASLQPLMHLQEVSNNLQEKARACAHAQDLLKTLDILRDGLLVGAFSRQDLAHMAQQLSGRSHENIDPQLQEVLEQIEQRVHIELTKIELSQNGTGF